jgi:hypothetical protein
VTTLIDLAIGVELLIVLDAAFVGVLWGAILGAGLLTARLAPGV